MTQEEINKISIYELNTELIDYLIEHNIIINYVLGIKVIILSVKYSNNIGNQIDFELKMKVVENIERVFFNNKNYVNNIYNEIMYQNDTFYYDVNYFRKQKILKILKKWMTTQVN